MVSRTKLNLRGVAGGEIFVLNIRAIKYPVAFLVGELGSCDEIHTTRGGFTNIFGRKTRLHRDLRIGKRSTIDDHILGRVGRASTSRCSWNDQWRCICSIFDICSTVRME